MKNTLLAVVVLAVLVSQLCATNVNAASETETWMQGFGDVMVSTGEEFVKNKRARDEGLGDTSCSLTRACTNSGTPAGNLPWPNANLSGATPAANLDIVQIKAYNPKTFDAASQSSVAACVMTQMKDTFKKTYLGSSSTTAGSSESQQKIKPGSVLYQYYAGSNDNFGVYPARNWGTEYCRLETPGSATSHASYKPTERPYYVSGATGPKDLVILIDVSNTMPNSGARLDWAKESAQRLLGSLGFTDFVAVIPYHQVPDTNISISMARATINTISSLQAKVEALELSQYEALYGGEGGTVPADVGTALEAAATLLHDGTLSGESTGKNEETSGCSQSIVFLSSGVNDVPKPDPIDVMLGNNITGAIIFGYALVPGATTLQDAKEVITKQTNENANRTFSTKSGNPIAALACSTNGVYRVAFADSASNSGGTGAGSSSGDHVDAFVSPLVSSYINYFSALTEHISGTRWSEVYTDHFGQGEIISSSLPIYEAYTVQPDGSHLSMPAPTNASTPKEVELYNGYPKDLLGLLVMDIPFRNLSSDGALSESDVETTVLKEQVCDRLDHESEVNKKKIAHLSNAPVCESLAGEELSIRKLRPLYITLSVFLPIILMLIPVIAGCIGPDADDTIFLRIVAMIIFLLLWIICLSLFWVATFDDIVRRDFYKPVTYTVIAQTENSYPCCGLHNCQCTNYFGASCNSKLANLQEGSCNAGYHCCNYVTYQCNCRTVRSTSGSGKNKRTTSRRECDTCRRCTQSVSARKCVSKCGTCFSPVVTVSYEYEGRTIISRLTQACSSVFDATACKNSFLASQPLQSKHTGYVDPSNPRVILTNVDWNTVYLVFFVLFAVLSIIPCGGSYCFARADFKAICCSGGCIPSSSGSGRSKLDSHMLDDNFTTTPSEKIPEKTAAQRMEEKMMKEQEAEENRRRKNDEKERQRALAREQQRKKDEAAHLQQHVRAENLEEHVRNENLNRFNENFNNNNAQHNRQGSDGGSDIATGYNPSPTGPEHNRQGSDIGLPGGGGNGQSEIHIDAL